MKLANALSQRANLQQQLQQLQQRLGSNALVQEGEEPAEDPQELLQALEEGYARLETLITCINRTNNTACTADGTTLTALLARRDCLTGKLNALRGFLASASARVQRHTASEIRIHSTVNVRQLQKQVDRLSAQLRQLDETIQELNWTTEMVE